MWNCNIVKLIPASGPYFSYRATFHMGFRYEYSLFLCVYLTCGISTLAIKPNKCSLQVQEGIYELVFIYCISSGGGMLDIIGEGLGASLVKVYIL